MIRVGQSVDDRCHGGMMDLGCVVLAVGLEARHNCCVCETNSNATRLLERDGLGCLQLVEMHSKEARRSPVEAGPCCVVSIGGKGMYNFAND
jgi:hypothetical protein